jgi:hypothetical protein
MRLRSTQLRSIKNDNELNRLYAAAGEIPSWHIAPVRTGTVTDRISGSQIITFTNSSPAWGFNSSGVLVQPTANVPFIEYDPATGACLGWRVWDAVTNRFIYSAGIGGTGWSLLNATATQAAATDPSGGTAAALLVENSALGTHYVRQSATITAGETITLSVFAQPYATGSPRRLMLFAASTQFGGNTPSAVFNLQTQAVISATNCTALLQSLPDNRFRCSMTPTVAITTTGSNAFDFRLDNGSTTNYTGDGTSGLYLWGAQLNTGALAPYVPTTSLTASSTADVASITGAAFAGIWNDVESTVVCRFFSDNTAGSGRTSLLFDVGAGGAFGTTGYGSFTTSGWFINPSTAPMNLQSSVAASAGTKAIGTMAARFKANDSRIAVNGTLGTLDSSCAVPASPTTLYIGRSGWTGSANYANGYIQEFATLKSGRPDPNLTAISAT